MAFSAVRTVDEYLAELPEDRLEAIETVREEILRKLPEGYEECMQYGMIGYVIPLYRYPETYNNSRSASSPWRHRRTTWRFICTTFTQMKSHSKVVRERIQEDWEAIRHGQVLRSLPQA